MFSFRRAEVADKKRICEISSKIWEGTDYIPSVFDEWVSELKGEFTVAEYEGEIVGFAKYSRIVENEAWLEGIRADLSIQGKGFGEAMTKYFINKAKEEKMKALRLSTYIENYKSINIIERCGFEKDGCFSYCSKQLKPEDIYVSAENVVTNISIADAWRFIENSRFYLLSKGYIAHGWRFYKLTYELLDGLIRAGKVVGTVENETITAMAIIMGEIDSELEISIGFIDGKAGDKRSLMNYIENSATARGVQSIEIMSALDQELIDILIDTDYQFEYAEPRQDNVYVYAYHIK